MRLFQPVIHALNAEHHLEGRGDINRIGAVSCLIKLGCDVLPSLLGPVFFRQVTQQLAHVGQCSQRHHARDYDGLRQRPRPVGELCLLALEQSGKVSPPLVQSVVRSGGESNAATP